MSNLAGRKPYERVSPVRDPEARLAWALERPYCQFCGLSMRAALHEWGVGISTHHIVKPGRSDEPCNLLNGCWRDHGLCEGLLIRQENGDLYQKLTLGVVLSIKRLRDPQDYDPVRLAVLYRQALPDEEPIPQFLLSEWKKNKGAA